MSLTPLSKRPVFYLSLVAIIIIVLAAQVGAFYQLQNLFRTAPGISNITVSALINYGNGTSKWHNRTDVPSGSNFYEFTTTIAQTEATLTVSVSSQHYIVGLDGVRGNERSYWTLWVFCQKDEAWTPSPVGADLVKLTNGDLLAWYYQAPASIDATTWDPPVAGARKVDVCPSRFGV